jgi:hypothetical protein
MRAEFTNSFSGKFSLNQFHYCFCWWVIACMQYRSVFTVCIILRPKIGPFLWFDTRSVFIYFFGGILQFTYNHVHILWQSKGNTSIDRLYSLFMETGDYMKKQFASWRKKMNTYVTVFSTIRKPYIRSGSDLCIWMRTKAAFAQYLKSTWILFLCLEF